MSWARAATPQLLNSVVNVDDAVQTICNRFRLRFERFECDLNGVTICEGCNYRERRLQSSIFYMVPSCSFGGMSGDPHANYYDF